METTLDDLMHSPHYTELKRRIELYRSMDHEQLLDRLEVLEGFVLGTLDEPAPLIGMPGENEAHWLEDGATPAPFSEPAFADMTPEDEANIRAA